MIAFKLFQWSLTSLLWFSFSRPLLYIGLPQVFSLFPVLCWLYLMWDDTIQLIRPSCREASSVPICLWSRSPLEITLSPSSVVGGPRIMPCSIPFQCNNILYSVNYFSPFSYLCVKFRTLCVPLAARSRENILATFLFKHIGIGDLVRFPDAIQHKPEGTAGFASLVLSI